MAPGRAGEQVEGGRWRSREECIEAKFIKDGLRGRGTMLEVGWNKKQLEYDGIRGRGAGGRCMVGC